MSTFLDAVRKRAIRVSTTMRVDGCAIRVDGGPKSPGDEGLVSLLAGLPAGQEIAVRGAAETSETGIVLRANQVLTAGDLVTCIKAHIRAYHQVAGTPVPAYATEERQRRSKDVAKDAAQ